MKESRVYLNFFTRNLALLIIPVLITAILVTMFILQKPKVFLAEGLYELPYTKENIPEITMVADEAVTKLRSRNFLSEIKATNDSVYIYKPGPVSIKIEIKSDNKEQGQAILKDIEKTLFNEYQATIVGNIVESQKIEFSILSFLLPVALVFSVSLALTLTKEYFKKY